MNDPFIVDKIINFDNMSCYYIENQLYVSFNFYYVPYMDTNIGFGNNKEIK